MRSSVLTSKSNKMDFYDMLRICGDVEECRQFCRANNLLVENPACPAATCQAANVVMTWVKLYPRRQNAWCWRCPRCRARWVQERSGSIFENSALPLEKIVCLIHLWSHQTPVKTTMAMLGLRKKAVVDWFKVSVLFLQCVTL